MARKYSPDFDERYYRRADNECWPWMGGFDHYGYGVSMFLDPQGRA
jgi:hypothetical protein